MRQGLSRLNFHAKNRAFASSSRIPSQKVSLVAHAVEHIDIDRNKLVSVRILDVGHLDRDIGVIESLQLLSRRRTEDSRRKPYRRLLACFQRPIEFVA
jgi:hypothetical protein